MLLSNVGIDDRDCMPCQIKRIASMDDMPMEDEG